MKRIFIINSITIPANELKTYLEEQLQIYESTISFEFRKSVKKIRQLDLSVLVAIVSTIGTGLGALIAGLLQRTTCSDNIQSIDQLHGMQVYEYRIIG